MKGESAAIPAIAASSKSKPIEGARKKPPVHIEQAFFLPSEVRKSVYRRFHDLEHGIVKISKTDRLNYRAIESALRTEKREEVRQAKVIAFARRAA